MRKSWYARYVLVHSTPYISNTAVFPQICTELLYQPLTLLDCLHTFCGSCVKEWFSAQGARHSRDSPRFTCPSCRAEVRDTRPNATVTTLLDMVLTAHPDRARATDEKSEIATRYTHGESVFPTLPSGGESADEDGEDDRRVIEEVRELSLRESRTQARRETRRTGQSSRTRERSTNTERPAEDGRSRRRRDDDAMRQHRTLRPDDSDRTRRVEHQSSLRSLLSLSSDAETMEEEILRQILEDGLLDNINLDNLGPRQEEELSERIADAYRRRHMQRSQSRQRQEQGREQRQEADGATRTHARSESAHRTADLTAAREHNVRRPPVSRPHLFDSAPARPSTAGHQRRSSEQVSGRRRTSPVRTNQASASDEAIRPAARSSSDITADRHVSQAGRLRSESASARPRRATESERSISSVWGAGGRERSSRQATSQSATNSPISGAAPSSSSRHLSHPDHTVPSLSSPLVPIRSDRRTRPSSSRSNVPSSPIVQFPEPSISCDRCGKGNIQYTLHKRCTSCKEGNFHLCLRCYRSGSGCHRWSGFGASAHTTFQRIVSSSTRRPVQINDPGHVLMWFKYQRPSETAHRTMSGERQMTSDNPVRRLQSGLFCDTCQSSANDCFWKCNQCNEGDWGFCNSCVNKGRGCTHSLLPIRRIIHSPPPSASSTTPAPAESNTLPTSSEMESFKILSFSTNCDICTYPIPASTTRYHCLECNSGDYDVCTNCYLKLVATGKINKENGHNGWRRCLSGHRMIVVGFEDHEEGQRRVIVRDLVGGRALKDEHVTPSQSQSPTSSPATGGPIASPELGTGDWSWKDGPERRKKASRLRAGPALTNSTTGSTAFASDPSNPPLSSPTAAPIIPPFRRFPPDGGVGLIVHALWSWYPEEEVEDELVFPRGAHITECENINDDWFWGCYAGRTGLFPGSHVEFVREVHR